MTAEQTSRFGIFVWPSDLDEFSRSQLHISHTNIEDKAALFRQDAYSTIGSAVSWPKTFFYATDLQILWYSDGSTWRKLTDFGTAGSVIDISPGDAASAGTADQAARIDHRHAVDPWGINAQISQVSTTSSAGTLDVYARGDHRHIIGSNAVTAGTIANGAINSVNAFTAGVVQNAVIADSAVTKAKISADQQIPSGAIWAFGGTTTPPSGWLFCNGASYSTSLHPDLFAVIGYSYGGSSGTFMVPNLCDRMPRGAGNVTTSLGATAGADAVTIGATNLPNHLHSFGSIAVADHGSHVHSLNGVSAAAVSNNDADHTHVVAAANASGQVDNTTVSMNDTVFGLFYGPSGESAGNGNTDAGLFPDGWSGGPSPIPVQSAAARINNNAVTVLVAEHTTNTAKSTSMIPETTHGHTLTGNSGSPTTTLTHSVSGNTGNPTGTTGTALSVIPKTQTVNYIIKT